MIVFFEIPGFLIIAIILAALGFDYQTPLEVLLFILTIVYLVKIFTSEEWIDRIFNILGIGINIGLFALLTHLPPTLFELLF